AHTASRCGGFPASGVVVRVMRRSASRASQSVSDRMLNTSAVAVFRTIWSNSTSWEENEGAKIVLRLGCSLTTFFHARSSCGTLTELETVSNLDTFQMISKS